MKDSYWQACKFFVFLQVAHWGRKAATCGFHFLPVPKDPFALPFSPNSDPLRGPIFVPLNVNCLMTKGKELFEGLLIKKCV